MARNPKQKQITRIRRHVWMSKVLGSNLFKKKLLSSFQLGEEFLFGRKTRQCLNFGSLIRENVGDVDERRQAVQPDPGSVVA